MFSLFSRRERIRYARLLRENSPSPTEEAVASFKVRSPKNAILLRFVALYSMCPQHRNVCDAPLCGSMSKHFTRSFVAQRFKSAFHVFAKAKTFHFCAEDMLAYCSLLSAQKFHVRSKGAQVRLMFIVPLRRTSSVQLRASVRSRLPNKFNSAFLPTVQQHYIKRKSSLSRLSELLLFRRRRFTISTSSSTSTSSFTSSSEPNGNNISSVRLSRTARTSSEKFSHDFVRAERRQYSCGIVKRRLCKRSEKSRSEADL